MSEHNERAGLDVLDRATAALRDTPISDGPPADLVSATVQALQTSAARFDGVRLQRKKQMVRVARYCAAAAVLLAAGTFWLIDRSASFTFAQVVDNVKNAKSVSFVVKQKVGDQPEQDTRVFIQGDIVRHETADLVVLVLDTSQRKGLQLDVQRKVASKVDLEGRVPKEELTEPIDRLRNLKEDNKENFQQLADEEVNERKCHVYQVKGAKGVALLIPEQFKLWVDAKSGMPVKIHAENEQFSLLYEQFKWNEPLKQELFSLAVPKGYRLEELAPAVVRPGRIYYHKGWVELHSITPDGKVPETQFVPRPENSPSRYVSDRAELSPDGRYLAIAYSHATKKGLYPPNRVLLWDRTNPKEPPVEVYLREDGELESWQYSPNGLWLFVSWLEAIPPRQGPKLHTGTAMINLKTKTTKTAIKLPTYKDAEGDEAQMRFAAPSTDPRQYLVFGNGLFLATSEGTIVRRLSAADAIILDGSVRVSPDGTRALYATYHQDGSHALNVVTLKDGHNKELVSAGRLTHVRATWSPDSKRICYTSRLFDPKNPPFQRGAETFLKVVDADGSNVVTLLTEKAHPKGPSLELTGWR